jgi:hypothetical protein
MTALMTWLDTSALAQWIAWSVILLAVYLGRRALDQRRAWRRLSWCPSCREPIQGNFCQNCSDPMESPTGGGAPALLRDAGMLPAWQAHLQRMHEAVAESRQRAHGHPAGVTLHCEVDTLLRWAGIGSDDRRLV